MTRARYAILLILAAITVNAASAAEVEWRTTRTKHFLIYHTQKHEDLARRTGEFAEEWHGKLSQRMNFQPGNLIPLYLYPDRGSFAEATGVGRGDPVVGLAHSRTLTIKVDSSGAFTDIAYVIPHEMVHVFFSLIARHNVDSVPTWMNEGLAKYFADDWSVQDRELLADAAAGSQILRLDSITRSFPADPRKRAVAYVQSYSIVKYIADTYTPAALTDFLAEMKDGKRFREALFYSIGRTPEELEHEWRQYLWDEYNLDRWLKVGSAAVGAAMALLAVLAFRARLIRKRRKAAEMEQEDGLDPTPY